MTNFPLLPILILALATPAFAADAPARTEADILKSVKLPEGYEATVFAMPPTVGYPTAVSASPDGVLFVAVDENGSLDAKPGRGRVLRCSIRMATERRTRRRSSPRWTRRAASSGTARAAPRPARSTSCIRRISPPIIDTDGDGKSDKQEDIVTGLGFD